VFPNLWQPLTKDTRIDYFNSMNSTFHGFPIIKSLESADRIGFPFYKTDNELAGIQTKLIRPLTAGKKYEVSIIIAQCNYSNFAINKIPFILSKNAVTAQEILEDENITVNVISLEKYVLYTQNWIKVRAIITAKGGEEYFTLINNRVRFSTPKETGSFVGCNSSSTLDKYFDKVAYYFIDAIELIEKLDNSKDACSYTTTTENAKDALLIAKVEELKSKKILHPTSPTSFTKMKSYTHHIVLFDISASMQGNMSSAKQIFDKIYATVGEKDIVTGLVFSHISRTLFTRAGKSEALKKEVNELSSSGGTILESGLMLVNNNIVADENTKIYLITDVRSSKVSKLLTQYVSIKLTNPNSLPTYELPSASCFEYNYINNYTTKDTYTASGIYESKNVFRIHYMSKREANKFEKELESDNYIITDITKCKFDEDNVEEYDTLLSYNKQNFFFLFVVSV